MAFASAIVAFNAPPVRKSAKDDARKFAAKFIAAEDHALFSGKKLRLEIEGGRYFFSQLQEGEWSRNAAPSFMRNIRVQQATTIEFEIDDASLQNVEAITGVKPEENEIQTIALNPVGIESAFVARFTNRGKTWLVLRNEAGDIVVERE